MRESAYDFKTERANGGEEEEGTETLVLHCAILQLICTNQSTALHTKSGNLGTSTWVILIPFHVTSPLFLLTS